jgi:queuine tRNA-ribosyltransferase
VSVCTSVGFQSLDATKYARDVETLQADIVIGLGDIPYERSLGSKRVEVATDRNIEWLQDHIAARKSSHGVDPADGVKAKARSHLFASLLPVPCFQQQFFIDHLTAQFSGEISGLALYSPDTLEDVPVELDHLPRLAFTAPTSPQEVLRQISLGMDVLTVPFITTATDAGIALQFTFPVPEVSSAVASEMDPGPYPLGIDMWSPAHATSLSPLTQECTCYACTDHHRAFIQHLLSAKEMLGWVLLQIHNHSIVEKFFAGVRTSLAAGIFETDTEDFNRRYESFLPAKTGQGPRYVLRIFYTRLIIRRPCCAVFVDARIKIQTIETILAEAMLIKL